MIGVTGGTSTTNTTKNTYYILSNTGNLYSLGDNTQKQCGDFTTTERLTWVQVKKSSAANDYLINVNFFSCQEHNASYPAVAAINTNGELFTWGNNSSGMVGRTDDGTLNGSLNTVSFDPGFPVGFTGKAVSVEMGGHTMVYLKEGSSQFCYVGHYIDGSMGDGGKGNNGSPAATKLLHNCSSTPSINICGSVPTVGSIVNSTISVSKNSITADGSSTSVISIQLKDVNGNNLTSSGGVVTMNTTSGTLGDVVDNNNGTYTVILTSSTSPGTADLSFNINGSPSNKTAKVDYTTGAVLPLTWVSMQAFRQNQEVKITWTTATEVNVKDFQVERSLDANKWELAVAIIPASGGPANNYYHQIDSIYNPQKLFYRVRQRDLDGSLTYSPIRVIPAVTGVDKITIYPTPANNNFHLIGGNSNKIKTVRLMSINGNLIKTWNQFQSTYDISEILSGNYLICIETSEDVQYIKLMK